jgi:hypothetical protein
VYVWFCGEKKLIFDIIDYVKLILTKIYFKLKWFMFGYIHAKMNVKINFRIRIILEAESILLLINQTSQN